MTKEPARGVTGRDGIILMEALAYAIAVIPHLPDEYQAWSNREDMLKLLHFHSGPQADFWLKQAAETVSHVEDKYRTDGTTA